MEHHSVCNKDCGRCNWSKYPGRKRTTKEANRSYYDTRYKCVECSMRFGKDHYFCNDFSTTITITISRNYGITSVLYVFY